MYVPTGREASVPVRVTVDVPGLVQISDAEIDVKPYVGQV